MQPPPGVSEQRQRPPVAAPQPVGPYTGTVRPTQGPSAGFPAASQGSLGGFQVPGKPPTLQVQGLHVSQPTGPNPPSISAHSGPSPASANGSASHYQPSMRPAGQPSQPRGGPAGTQGSFPPPASLQQQQPPFARGAPFPAGPTSTPTGGQPFPPAGPRLTQVPLANGHTPGPLQAASSLPDGLPGPGPGARPPFSVQQQQQQQYAQRPVTPSSPRPHAISISGPPSGPPSPMGPPSRTSSSGAAGPPPLGPPPLPAFSARPPPLGSFPPQGPLLRPPGAPGIPHHGPPGAPPLGASHPPGPRPPAFGPAPTPPFAGTSQQQLQAPQQQQISQQAPGPAQMRQSRSMKVDERQVPRPASRGSEPQVFETRREGGKMNAPPPAASSFIVRDNGNASPRVMRCTLNSVPNTADLLKTACVPLAVIVQPLAQPQPGDDVMQVVDFGEAGPLRCSSCGAYINPYMQFLDAGRIFRCNFCHQHNQTPLAYVENTGPDGRRRDADQRPELSRGSVEYVASLPMYMVRQPMPPTHLFLIDVSHNAVSTGATAAACTAIADALDVLQGGGRAHVGVATFDSTIHFYPLRRGQEQAQMLVVPDVNDVYCPLPSSLLVPVAQARPMVDRLLEQIPSMFADTQTIDTCAGAAIHAALLALKGGVGGKLQVFLTSLPKVGAHALQLRDGGAAIETKDAKILQPANKDYNNIAAEAADAQISIDLFVLASASCDIATLSSLTQPTAGQVYHYHPYSAPVHDDQLANDLRWNIMRPQGWEAICRLRCSEGLEVDKCLGGFYQRTLTDIEFPALSAEHALAIRLRHTAKLKEEGEAYLQFAMLYSTPEGVRRIRVHTLALPVSNVMGAIFRGADLDAFLNYTAHLVVSQAPGKTPKACQEAVTKACVDMLLSYRKNCAVTSRAGQLILPEPLQLLPLYSLAFIKSPALRVSVRPDVRAAWLARLSNAPCSRIIALLWPRLLPLHPLVQSPPPPGQPIELPEPVSSLSARVLDQKGIYLLENGSSAVVHFGPDAPPEHIMVLLGTPSIPKMEGPSAHLPMPLPQLDNPASSAVHDLIAAVQKERATWLALSVARLHSPDLADFHAALVEDRSGVGQSYMEYLCAVHQHIQNLVS